MSSSSPANFQFLFSPLYVPDISDFDHDFQWIKTLPTKGNQGFIAIYQHKPSKKYYILKIGQNIDSTIQHEYQVMHYGTNKLRELFPNFVGLIGMIHHTMNSCYFDTLQKANRLVPETASEEELEIVKRQQKCSNFLKPIDDPKFTNIETECLLIEYIPSLSFSKYIFKNKLTFLQIYSIIKQTLLVIQAAQEISNFCHYDLHSDNILIGKLDVPTIFLYRFASGKLRYVVAQNLFPVLIDYGFAYIKDLDNTPFSVNLGHTDYGYVMSSFCSFCDMKFLAISLLNDLTYLTKVHKIELPIFDAKIHRRVIKALKDRFKKTKISLDTGWDYIEHGSVQKVVARKIEFIITDHRLKHMDIFITNPNCCIELIHSMETHPLDENVGENQDFTKEFCAIAFELAKILQLSDHDFTQLYFLKCLISTLRKYKERYNTSNKTQILQEIKQDMDEYIQDHLPLISVKLNVNYELLLCACSLMATKMKSIYQKEMKKILDHKRKDYRNLGFEGENEVCLELYDEITGLTSTNYYFFEEGNRLVFYDLMGKEKTKQEVILLKEDVEVLHQAQNIEEELLKIISSHNK